MSKEAFEFGTIRSGTKARRNKKTGLVEVLLWPKGYRGHLEDFYHKCGDGWETTFKITPKK